MPIYEYECSACGARLEKLQKFNDAPLRECPSCHKKSLKRLLSRTSFQLKGSGWYVTDFKDKDTSKTKPESPKEQKPVSKTKENKETPASPAK